jgi:hypothetical protein
LAYEEGAWKHKLSLGLDARACSPYLRYRTAIIHALRLSTSSPNHHPVVYKRVCNIGIIRGMFPSLSAHVSKAMRADISQLKQ